MYRKISFVLLLSLFVSSIVFAEQATKPNRANLKRAVQYMKDNNLGRFRVVKKMVGNRQITRIFVPITTESSKDFLVKMVGSKKGSAVLVARPSNRYPSGYDHYVRLGLEPGVGYSSHYDRHVKFTGDKAFDNLGYQTGARYPVLNIGRKANRKMAKFLKQFHKTGSYGNEAKAYKENRGDKAGDTSADCMWWLTNVESHPKKIGRDANLMKGLGVKLTRGPQEMPSIIIHAAKNSRASVVGIAVNDLQSFRNMTTEQLMGNEPTNGGAAGSVR